MKRAAQALYTRLSLCLICNIKSAITFVTFEIQGKALKVFYKCGLVA